MLPNLRKSLGSDRGARRFLLLLLLFVIAAPLAAQIDIQRYTTATDTFYWKRYINVPKPARANLKKFRMPGGGKAVSLFLAWHGHEFFKPGPDSTAIIPLSELQKHIIPVDINSDGTADIVYSGTDGGAADIVRIWIGRNGSFELVFEDYQYITQVRKSGRRFTELQTGDPGNGTEHLYFTRDYRIEEDNGMPVFVKVKQTAIYKHTEEPSELFDQPLPFKSISDTLMLRASAARLNEPFLPGLSTFGNIVAKYSTRSRGLILAAKYYGKGNTWFFVEMSPFAAPSASIIYDSDKMPTFIRGWVSSNAIRQE
jgi:hypothetical protein